MPTTLVATPEPDSVPPRTLLELEYTGQTEATVTRLDPDGRSRPVRLAEPAVLSGGLWTGYDYESWLNEPATYTATTAGGSVDSDEVILIAGPWLRHPGVPSLSVIIEPVGPIEDRTRPVNEAIQEPLGRVYPVVITDGRRKAIRSALSFRTRTPEEADALVAIMDDTVPLLIDVGAYLGLGFVHAYLAFGDLVEKPFRDDYGPDQWRTFTARYTVVDRPAGGIQSQRTYADLLVEASTYQDLRTMYDTYSDLLTGTT